MAGNRHPYRDYPDRIEYTGNGTTIAPANYVKFYREARNDAPEMYTTNFKVKTAYRLKTIEAVANSAVTNAFQAYKLTYKESVSSSQSLLANVQQFGGDVVVDRNTGNITNEATASKLPAMSFDKLVDEKGFGPSSSSDMTLNSAGGGWNLLGDFNGDGRIDTLAILSANSVSVNYATDSGFRIQSYTLTTAANGFNYVGDFNGDGKMDLFCAMTQTTGWMYYSTDNGFTPVYISTGLNINMAGSGEWNRVGDFNGDGKADLLSMLHGPTFGLYSAFVYYGTETGFNGDLYASLRTNTTAVELNQVGDFNGDGKTDLLSIISPTTAYVNYATGSGFNAVQHTGMQINTATGGWNRVGDFNGDGKADLLAMMTSTTAYVNYATGSGFDTKPVYTGMQINTAASEWNLVGDFNGDGKADIAAILPSSVPKNYVLNPHSLYVNYATGSGFSTVEYPNVPVMTAPGGWNRVADFSGDGKADFIYLGALTSSGWWGTLSKSTASLDLIDSFSNGLGGLSTIDYTPSTRYANTQLPFPLQTVSKITTNDGNGNNSITGYTYSGGFYHIGERDFRGFNYAKITGPTGPNNEQKITETWFHQGNDTAVYANNPNVLSGYMKGKPYLTQVSDLLGRIYSKMEIIYATDRNNAAPWFNPPLQVDTAICSAGNFTGYCKSSGGAKLLRTVYKYDDYSDVITDELGNVTLEYQYGDLTDATDDRTITRTFSPNTTKWIVGLPSGESVYQGIGTTTKVAGKTYYYDDLSSCAAVPTNNQTPVKGNLTRFVNWLNGGTSLETRMAYDPYGNPSCGRDANGNTSMITYDASHTFPKTTTNPLSQQTTTQYYGVDGIAADYGLYGQVKSVTDPNDSTITRIYDKLGRITKIADPYTTAYSSLDTYGTVSYQYLNFGTVGQQKVVTLTTEKADNLTAPYCPPGVNSYYDGVQYNMCKSAYYGCYSSLFSTNCHCPSGYFYIGGGTCLAYPYCPTGGYFDPGQDACRSPNYVWSENYFDGLGRTYKTRKEGPDGKVIVTETMYDGRGAVAKTSLPYFEGTETPRYQTFTYDSVGRTTQITKKDAANNVVSVTKACYDTNITVLLDENSHRKRETRDALGRLIKVEEYTGTYPACTTDAGAPYATTGYVYDVMNNLRYVTDAKGNQTEMRYNTLGRKYYMSDPDMGSWYYTYDGNGNLITQKDARNQTITFTYDALNRLKIKDYPTGTDVNYTYDETASSYPVGRLTSMSDESGATRYHYDKLGRTVKSEKTAGGVNYPLEFTYDIMGRATSLKYPDGEIVGYGYDPSGNLAQAIGYATYSGFNALGQPGSLAYGNGVNTTYAYYPTHSRLQNITTKKDTLSLQNLSYGYDNRGNINGISNLLDTTRSQILSYDDLDRLKTAQSTSYGSLSYNYDQIGNITLKEGVTYTPYPGKAHAIGSTSSGRTYTYDNNGNITSDGTRTFTYTFDNMPRTINGNITFLYDGDGNRAKKTTSAYSSVYIDKLYECTTTGGATSCAKYIFAGDQRIAVKTAAETLYYHPDHLGSTALATDGTGVSKEVITYYPYGKTKSDTGTANLDHKYTSQELDGEVGLYNYGARLYDPEIGRFITPDTIIPDPANPQSLNRYSYVLNNPIMYTDPNGRFPWAAIFIGALIGTVSSGIQSDWDIGAMLAGGVIGGVAGGVGGYMGGLYNGAVGGAAAGATAGGLSSAYYGGNVMDGILKGAVIGGIGGAAFEGIGAYYGNTWNLGRVGVYGLAGGGLSELAGGNFAEGFMYAFALAVSAYSYSSSTVDF